MIIESFASTDDDEEPDELMAVLHDFYTSHHKKEMQHLWGQRLPR